MQAEYIQLRSAPNSLNTDADDQLLVTQVILAGFIESQNFRVHMIVG